MNRKRKIDFEPASSKKSRTRFTLTTICRCLDLRDEGKSLEQTIQIMKTELKIQSFWISRSSWYSWYRNKDQYREAKRHRAKNKSHAPSDKLDYKQEAVKKFEFRSEIFRIFVDI